jgi:hypothetical protein
VIEGLRPHGTSRTPAVVAVGSNCLTRPPSRLQGIGRREEIDHRSRRIRPLRFGRFRVTEGTSTRMMGTVYAKVYADASVKVADAIDRLVRVSTQYT